MRMPRLYNAYPADLEEFNRKLSRLLNWHLPTIPLVNQRAPLFVNTADWDWPLDSQLFEGAGVVIPAGRLLSFGDQASAK